MKKLIAIMTILVLVSSGCSDAERAAFSALGKKHRVTLYSGGKQIGQWTTSGKIENEQHSNGYYFNDDATQKLIMVDGDIIIEVIN